MNRQDTKGLVAAVGVLLVVLILIVAGMWAVYYVNVRAEADTWVPVVDLELSKRQVGNDWDYYRADTDLDTADQSFLRYWYSASVADPGFPEGDHTLRIKITYEWYDPDTGQQEIGVLADRSWEDVGVHQGDLQQVDYRIEFPELERPPEHRQNENAVFWIRVYWDGAKLAGNRYTVNFGTMEVTET